MGNYYTPAPVGNGSMVLNGQIVPVPMTNSFFPNLAQAPIYKGNGQGPPTIPINYMNNYSGMTDTASAIASANPWSFTQSPIPMLIIALVVGFLVLRFVHFR